MNRRGMRLTLRGRIQRRTKQVLSEEKIRNRWESYLKSITYPFESWTVKTMYVSLKVIYSTKQELFYREHLTPQIMRSVFEHSLHIGLRNYYLKLFIRSPYEVGMRPYFFGMRNKYTIKE